MIAAADPGPPLLPPGASADPTTYRDERLIAFEGAYNFRDIGGYIGAGGQRVRKGLVFRSDNLNTLTDADLELFRRVGVKVVHDFRLELERDRQPSRFPSVGAPEVMVLSTSDAAGVDAALVDIVHDALAGKRPFPPPSFWEDSASNLVDQARPMFAALLNSLVGVGRLPAMYHCSAGKDRTGLATALIHRLLGVSEADIMTDYLLTNRYRVPVRMAVLMPQLAAIGVTEEQALPVIGVIPSAIEGMLRKVDEEYGGPEAYLVGAGMDPWVPERVRELLLEG